MYNRLVVCSNIPTTPETLVKSDQICKDYNQAFDLDEYSYLGLITLVTPIGEAYATIECHDTVHHVVAWWR